ncbi:MAG: Ig-like domain-containing protein, partial [Flavobacteriales bacterium]
MKILPLLLTFFCVQLSFAQSLVINEVSQGSSGAKEYVELLVIPDPSQPVSCTEILPCLDLRGWIFDDNNGYFTGGPATGVGIAAGACRFSNDLFWSCVPVGTIILIYNDNDFDSGVIPSADTDLLDGDCDLSIPITSSLFERVDSPLIPNSGDMSYPTLASDWVSGGIWSQIGMSNTNDSFQIYDPSNMAAPVHGVSWGNNSTNNIIFFAGSAAGNVFYATNTVDCDFADQANWVSGSTASGASDEQTAGGYNNSLNQSCIEALNNNCLNPMITSAVSSDEVCNCEATAYAEDPITDTSFTVGSDGNYTYEWFDNSTPFNSLGTGPTLTDLCAGVYNLIVTSGTGCVDTASVTIAPSNSAMITGNAPICSGSTLQLTGSGPDGANPWSSDTPAVATIDINGLVTGIIGGTSIITYTDINGCTDTTLVTVNQTPIIDPIGPLAVCDSLELPTITGTLTGLESYYSGPGGTGTAYTAGDWITSSITLYAYDSIATASICFDEETLVITINSALITGNATICSGSTLQLTGSSTAAFSSPWTSATPATATVDDFGIVTGVMAGTSIITYTNANNCTDTVTVSIIPLPVLTVQDTAICSPNTVDLTDSTYWFTDIGIITYFEANGTTPLADATAVGAGTYVLSADSLGCITTATVVVIVIPLPILTVQDTTTCSPNTVSLIDFTYWSTDIGVITYFESDGTTVVGDATAVGAGTYILSSNNLGCIATAPVVVTVNASPVIAATGLDPALCNGVNGEIEVTLSSGQTSLGVLDWIGTASGSNGSADITADSPDIIGLGAGSYNVTFTDVNGCVSNTELIGLNNPFAPIIDPISSIVSCADYDLVLANVTGTNITIALTFYALTGGPLVVGQQVINDQTFTAFTDTTIFVYDENGACSSEIQFNITINTTPTLTVQDTTTCSPSTVDLTDG